MQTYTTIAHGRDIAKIINLPKDFIDLELRLTIQPIKEHELEVDAVKYRDKKLRFSRPITIKSRLENDIWILENEDIGIISYGEDFTIAWESFSEDFIYLWNEIAKEDNDKLDAKALELKMYLTGLVKEA